MPSGQPGSLPLAMAGDARWPGGQPKEVIQNALRLAPWAITLRPTLEKG